MVVIAFAGLWMGRYVNFPGGAGKQCVDLTNQWLAYLKLPAVRRNAADWAGQGVVMSAVWVPNAASNFPSPGDIVVWHPNVPAIRVGPYGHVAVALLADGQSFISLDQDWPIDAPTAATFHNYMGVAGWHHLTDHTAGRGSK